MQQWEYYTEQIVSPGHNKKAHDQRMAELGDDGWELSGVGGLANIAVGEGAKGFFFDDLPPALPLYRMFFKRPKQSTEPYR